MRKKLYLTPCSEVQETVLEHVLLSGSDLGDTGTPGDLIDDLDPILF